MIEDTKKPSEYGRGRGEDNYRLPNGQPRPLSTREQAQAMRSEAIRTAGDLDKKTER